MSLFSNGDFVRRVVNVRRNSSLARPKDTIHQLMSHPALFEPIRRPRYPIVLCHGLYGFDTRGPAVFPNLRITYWKNVLNILRDKVGAEVIVTSVPGTGSIASRANQLDTQLNERVRGRGINFMAHSMGGLDARHLITHIRPTEYTPLSLTSISTPHRGSPFMDWCAANIGIGKLADKEEQLAKELLKSRPDSALQDTESSTKNKSEGFHLSLSSLPSSFTTLLLNIVDSPAYANLTSSYLNDIFNPSTPDSPHVKYYSVAARMDPVSIWHPFWLPKLVLDGVEEKAREKLSSNPEWSHDANWGNDGLVTVQSARWGEFLGTLEGVDHWEMRGARGIDLSVDLRSVPMMSGIANASDGWSLKDWGTFVGAWKKQDRKDKAERPKEDSEKSSSERLTAVFDWLVDQVPGSAEKLGKDLAASKEPPNPVFAPQPRLHELKTKADLEKFYVALARKLYDDGL